MGAPVIDANRYRIVLLAIVCLFDVPALWAQTVEVSPFYGYRFGNTFFELATRQPVDLDGAPAAGMAVDVSLGEGLHVEGLFTHQRGDVLVPGVVIGPGGAVAPVARLEIAVDHWLAGGLQEVGNGRVRPFAAAMVGLTRFAVEADTEIRFTAGAGGGVKLFPVRHIGARLDGRIYATILDAAGSAVACSPGVCFIGLRASVAWQAEFTATLVLRLP